MNIHEFDIFSVKKFSVFKVSHKLWSKIRQLRMKSAKDLTHPSTQTKCAETLDAREGVLVEGRGVVGVVPTSMRSVQMQWWMCSRMFGFPAHSDR